jgi:hypothetical protein
LALPAIIRFLHLFRVLLMVQLFTPALAAIGLDVLNA